MYTLLTQTQTLRQKRRTQYSCANVQKRHATPKANVQQLATQRNATMCTARKCFPSASICAPPGRRPDSRIAFTLARNLLCRSSSLANRPAYNPPPNVRHDHHRRFGIPKMHVHMHLHTCTCTHAHAHMHMHMHTHEHEHEDQNNGRT